MRMTGWLLAGFLLGFTGAAGAQVTYGNRPPPPPPPAYQGRAGYPGYGGGRIACESPDYRLARCPVPRGWRDVRIVQQVSDAACVRGRTWGYRRGVIWVDQGCRAVFEAYAGWRPGPGWNRNFEMSCVSPQYRYNFCQVDVGARGRVVLVRQLSDTRCVRGRNWGWNRAGIWVDKGCGARFRVLRRW